jgi:hypothetical protein
MLNEAQNVQFTYYSEKTVAQCLSALNERLRAKGTRTELDGWIDKGGEFSISTATRIAGAFTRRTYLRGKVERKDRQTVITGSVPDGAPLKGQLLVFFGLGLLGVILILMGNPTFGLAMLPIGIALYVPMKGDYKNSAVLIGELQRALKAKSTPIKKPDTPSARTTQTTAKTTRPPATRTNKNP